MWNNKHSLRRNNNVAISLFRNVNNLQQFTLHSVKGNTFSYNQTLYTPDLIKSYYMGLSFLIRLFISLPVLILYTYFHNAVGESICRDYVKCWTRRRERIMYISVNICTAELQRAISPAIFFALYLSISLPWICVCAYVCALELYALVARGIFVSWYDDKIAFHRAEPRRYISAFQALKKIALISRGRRRDTKWEKGKKIYI